MFHMTATAFVRAALETTKACAGGAWHGGGGAANGRASAKSMGKRLSQRIWRRSIFSTMNGVWAS